MSTNYSRTYLVSAATTTAVTVVPSSRAFATAARHNSSGMRSERGIVLATSATDRVDDLNALVTATPATIGEPDDGIATGHARGGLNDALQALARCSSRFLPFGCCIYSLHPHCVDTSTQSLECAA